ncbi:nucleotidyltransferase family protein [Ancylobacter sp. IITR112]|uniref:nucleotidyltransferase family protein n=1 Tax=Ancylobacter sp. IITR112 TaxID=3138073 RepID=UPI00352B33E9
MTTPPGLDLLRACLRWDAAGNHALRTLHAAGWAQIMELVRARDGHALLARRLTRAPDIPVPEEVAQELHRFKLDVAIRALAGLSLLAPAVAAAGVPVMALKGLDLAGRVYGDFGSRPMGDMDILVRPTDMDAMAAALSAQGFRADTARRQTTYHRLFHSPLPAGLPVELHWALGDRVGAPDRTDLLDALWTQAETVDIGGAPFLVPSRPLLLLYLCHHMEQHLFDMPLTHVWDVAEVLEQAGETFDAAAFARLCERFGQRKGVQAALHLMSSCLGIPTPAPPLPADTRALLPDVVANLGRYPKTPADEPSPDLVLLTSHRTPWRVRAHVLRRVLFPPRRSLAAGGRAVPLAYAGLWRDVLRRFLRLRVMRRIKAPPSLARPRRAARLSAWLR